MEERLKKLKQVMKKKVFNQLEFTDQLKNSIYMEIRKQEENDEYVYLSVMQLLVQEKTGVVLITYLRSRGIKKFEDNEGLLYSLLHRLEVNGLLVSNWEENEAKLYGLTDKGRKVLKTAEKKFAVKQSYLKEILEV